MVLADLVNVDGGTAPLTLGLFTALFTAIGIVAKGVFDARAEARQAAQEASTARQSADKAQKNTTNVSNGFANSVLQKLDSIDDRVDNLDRAMRTHLEWHVSHSTQNKE